MGLETGASPYHFVRRYLERNPQLPLSLRQADPLIRQLTYRDLIESRTQTQTGEPIMNASNSTAHCASFGWAAWLRCLKPACVRHKPKLMASIDLIACLVSDELTLPRSWALERPSRNRRLLNG